MPKKTPIPFSQKFPNVDPLALRLLERLIAFDPIQDDNLLGAIHKSDDAIRLLGILIALRAYSERDYEFACSKYMMFQSQKTRRNGLDEAEEDRAKAEAI
ncbi:hypothetical protein L1987_26086 [Smallanthus sonchifolius]|uniref:Uncharacterized protein n=1 Tax=Smallanthus sonchifolius TaxID=185202 RepID=A0ACB9I935_9ASTR|nr:hypothetical protein L1987_26086 [Smallanthus sonchifolius]